MEGLGCILAGIWGTGSTSVHCTMYSTVQCISYSSLTRFCIQSSKRTNTIVFSFANCKNGLISFFLKACNISKLLSPS